MTTRAEYRDVLRTLDDWEPYLLAESGLPGPRANLALVDAVADEGTPDLFRRLLAYGPDRAPSNNPHEFLCLCGVVGLGRLLADGHTELLEAIRQHANDPRWRIREGVAMALQRWGDSDMNQLLDEMAAWSKGNPLEKRAAAAALCEPRLLCEESHARRTLDILDAITTSLAAVTDRRSMDFEALRKGLSYCWSVAVAACPEAGKPLMEKWLASADKDIRRIMSENLRKDRLIRMDVAWVERCKARIQSH